MGESLRLDMTLQHTGGRQRAGDGKECYLTVKEIILKEKNRKGKTEQSFLSERKRNLD